MDRLQDYLRQAKECREAAGRATIDIARENFLRMAETWETLARQRQAFLGLTEVLANMEPDQ
jgi:hypothetical protein